jgi:nucleotide-binding universal stress UspA family protein
MSNHFYNILVPVDFTGKDKWAIDKAIDMANTLSCNVHFVFVMPLFTITSNGYFLGFNRKADKVYARRRLQELSNTHQKKLHKGSEVKTTILYGYSPEALKKYILQNDIDIVVKGFARFNLLHRIWSAVSISVLAKKANIPVLGVRSNGIVSQFKKIVLPLYNNVPLKRIRIAVMMGKYFKSTIYILSVKNTRHDNHINLLNQSLTVIQSLTTIPVQAIIVEGKSLAKETLAFSKKINADLIMITSVKDFYLPGWWGRITNKLLSYHSKIPVLTLDHSHD